MSLIAKWYIALFSCHIRYGWMALINDIEDENGQQAMINLQSHNNELSAKSRQIQDVKEQLKIMYKNEAAFIFTCYVTVLKEFLILLKMMNA